MNYPHQHKQPIYREAQYWHHLPEIPNLPGTEEAGRTAVGLPYFSGHWRGSSESGFGQSGADVMSSGRELAHAPFGAAFHLGEIHFQAILDVVGAEARVELPDDLRASSEVQRKPVGTLVPGRREKTLSGAVHVSRLSTGNNRPPA